MSSDKRQFSRIKLPVSVEVSVNGAPPLLMTSRDISDGGVFLEADSAWPDVSTGTQVQLKLNANLNGEPPPRIAGRVVRTTDEGIAVEFEPQQN